MRLREEAACDPLTLRKGQWHLVNKEPYTRGEFALTVALQQVAHLSPATFDISSRVQERDLSGTDVQMSFAEITCDCQRTFLEIRRLPTAHCTIDTVRLVDPVLAAHRALRRVSSHALLAQGCGEVATPFT